MKDNAGESILYSDSLIVFLKVLQSQYETGMIVCQGWMGSETVSATQKWTQFDVKRNVDLGY